MNNRIPNEIRASHRQQGHNRLIQEDIVHKIANELSNKIQRPLGQIELKYLITHLKKLDGNKFRTMPMDDAVQQIADGYFAILTANGENGIYDTHEIMKQYIGGGVRVTPDRFILKKECGSSTDTPLDHASITKVGDGDRGIRTETRIEEFTNNRETLVTNDSGVINTKAIDDVLIKNLKTKYNSDEDVPVYGEWLRKNNMIVPRERSISMLLDSRYKNRSIGTDTFSWTVSSVPDDSNGVVSTMKSMGNIINMQFGSFHIPYSAAAENVYKKVSLLIEELQFTATMAHENRHYHMLFDTEIQGNRIKCTPADQDDGKFRFNEPINYLKTISVTFGGPLNKLTFAPEYYQVTLTVNGVNSTYINFIQEHGVSDGEQIYIVGFNTASPSTDFAAIAAIAAEIGHTVSVVDNVTLEINTDLSTSTLILPSISVECYITTRRILIPIRFSYLT
jgi:hypothetical protein